MHQNKNLKNLNVNHTTCTSHLTHKRLPFNVRFFFFSCVCVLVCSTNVTPQYLYEKRGFLHHIQARKKTSRKEKEIPFLVGGLTQKNIFICHLRWEMSNAKKDRWIEHLIRNNGWKEYTLSVCRKTQTHSFETDSLKSPAAMCMCKCYKLSINE